MILPKDTTSHYQTIAGSKLHYIVCHANKAKTIVMLHGFSGNHRGLVPFINELPDYKIIALDFPGFGYSSPMTTQPHTIAGYTACVKLFLQKLNLPEPPLILGHSFGTVVAARLASEHPQLIASKLVLVSPASVSPLKTLSGRYVATLAGEAHYALGNRLGKAGDAWLKSPTISRISSYALITTKDTKTRQAIYAHHLSDLEFLKHKTIFAKAYKSLNRDGVINYAPHMPQKTLLIAGAKDAMWPPKTQQAVHKALPGSKLILLPHAGHLTHFEAPKQIGAMVRAFITP